MRTSFRDSQREVEVTLPILANVPAAVRFLSLEPLLGEVRLFGSGPLPDWVIAGCESGPRRRPMDLGWVRLIRDDCRARGVPFFFKQCELDGKVIKMPTLDGERWEQMPRGRRERE